MPKYNAFTDSEYERLASILTHGRDYVDDDDRRRIDEALDGLRTARYLRATCPADRQVQRSMYSRASSLTWELDLR